MQLTIELPEDVLQALTGRYENVPRYALEALGVEGYRAGVLTETQIKRMLGYASRVEVHRLLKEHGVPLHYSEADLASDLEAHHELGMLSGQ